MEKEQQELMFKLSMFEQQMQQIQQQLQTVEQGMVEMNSLNLGLDELAGSTGKEVLSPIGRGIFARTKLISEDLTVEIGGKNLIKKTIPETKKIIDEQIKNLEDVHKQLTKSLNDLHENLEKVIIEIQESKDKKGK